MSIATEKEANVSLRTASQTKLIQHFINGQFVPSHTGQTFDDVNPATTQVIAKVANGGKAEIDLAVAAAKEAFEHGPWPRMTLKDRCAVLKKIGDLILENKELLAKAEKYLLDDQPMIPIETPSVKWVKKPYVKGLYPNASSLFAWKFVYIERDPSKWDYATPSLSD